MQETLGDIATSVVTSVQRAQQGPGFKPNLPFLFDRGEGCPGNRPRRFIFGKGASMWQGKEDVAEPFDEFPGPKKSTGLSFEGRLP